MSLTHHNPKDIIVVSDTNCLSFEDKESNSQVKVIVYVLRTLLAVEKEYSQIKKRGFRSNFCSKKSSIDLFMEEALHSTDHYVYFWFQKRDPYIYCKLTSEIGEHFCWIITLRWSSSHQRGWVCRWVIQVNPQNHVNH